MRIDKHLMHYGKAADNRDRMIVDQPRQSARGQMRPASKNYCRPGQQRWQGKDVDTVAVPQRERTQNNIVLLQSSLATPGTHAGGDRALAHHDTLWFSGRPRGAVHDKIAGMVSICDEPIGSEILDPNRAGSAITIAN